MEAEEAADRALGAPGEGAGAPLGQDPKNSHRDSKVTRMGTASIPKLIVEFAIPAIGGMLVNGAYNIIDSIFLGQAMGEIGLSAVTVANPIMVIFIAISMLVGVGGNALASLRLGEGKRVDAETSLGNTVFLTLILWVLVIALVSVPLTLNGLLTLSSATDEIRPYAASFIRIIAFGFIFQGIGFGVNNFIRTAGAPNRALVTMIMGAVSCIILNYIFVMQMHMGVQGSALATVCGQAVSCASVLWYFTMTKNVPLRLHLKYMRPQLKFVKKILSFGLASFFVQAGAALLSFIMNYFLVIYGAASPLGSEDALASIGVVQRIVMFTMLPIIGTSVAIQPLIGYNYGARQISRVKKTLWYGVCGAVALGTVMWVIVHVFPTQIIGAFGIKDAGVVEFSTFALQVQLMMMPLVGFQIVGSNYFQATGQPLKSVILTLTRQIIFLIPLLLILPLLIPYLFPQFNNLQGLCFGYPSADFLSIFTTGVFVLFEMRRLKKLERGGGKATHSSNREMATEEAEGTLEALPTAAK